MPVEIRELVIRAEVNTRPGPAGPSERATATGAARERLVRDCVEQVMEILRHREER